MFWRINGNLAHEQMLTVPHRLPFSLPVVFRAQSVGQLPGVVNCGGPAASDGARLALVSGRWVSVVLKALSADVALVVGEQCFEPRVEDVCCGRPSSASSHSTRRPSRVMTHCRWRIK